MVAEVIGKVASLSGRLVELVSQLKKLPLNDMVPPAVMARIADDILALKSIAGQFHKAGACLGFLQQGIELDTSMPVLIDLVSLRSQTHALKLLDDETSKECLDAVACRIVEKVKARIVARLSSSKAFILALADAGRAPSSLFDKTITGDQLKLSRSPIGSPFRNVTQSQGPPAPYTVPGSSGPSGI